MFLKQDNQLWLLTACIPAHGHVKKALCRHKQG